VKRSFHLLSHATMKAVYSFFYLSALVRGVFAFASSPSHGTSSLSVTELKRLLKERGIDFRDCLEKGDLVTRLDESKSVRGAQTTFSRQYNSLTAEEDRTIETFKRVAPSVAFITISKGSSARGFGLPATETPVGTGSGFLWDKEGHVVTNCHVITPNGRIADNVMIKLSGMPKACRARVIGVEPDKDLAVLKIVDNAQVLPKPLEVGTSNDLQVGQAVLAIGNPFGLDNTLTTGIVSATGREVQGFGGRKIKGCVQTDAAINPGNSGGPLLDSRGRLIGVNTAIFSTGGGNVGIGFAIPVDTVRRCVNQIIRYGKVKRPTLGINVVDDRVTRSIGAQMRRELQGVLVAEILPNSPAAITDLIPTTMQADGSVRLGDLITRVNGQEVKQVEDLLAEIEEQNEGDIVTLGVLRRCDPKRPEHIRARLASRDSVRQVARGGAKGAMKKNMAFQ
jgi:S1-C subfamily serine protease